MAKTASNDDGLKKYDDLSAVDAVRLAWTEEGSNPFHHRLLKAEIMDRMPLLARALDRLANDLTFTADHLDPVESLKDALAFAADDWGDSRAKAWVYGILLGWDDEDAEDDEDAMQEMADRHGWTPEQVARLRTLHERFESLHNAASEQI